MLFNVSAMLSIPAVEPPETRAKLLLLKKKLIYCDTTPDVVTPARLMCIITPDVVTPARLKCILTPDVVTSARLMCIITHCMISLSNCGF